MASLSPAPPSIPLIHEHDLVHLQPGSKLTDTIINPYLKLLENRTTLPSWKVLALDSFFYSCLERKRHEIAARRFKSVNPFDYQLILIPIFIEAIQHWALIAVFPDLKRIHSYDSDGGSRKTEMYNIFYALKREATLRNFDMSPSAWHLQNTQTDCPRQANDIDCGVFVLWFAERLARGEEVQKPLLTFDPSLWREHVKQALTRGKIGIEDGFLAERGVNRPLPSTPSTVEIGTITDNKSTTEVATNTETPQPSTLDPMLDWVQVPDTPTENDSGERPDTDWLISEINKLDQSTNPSSPCLSIGVDANLLELELEDAMADAKLDTTSKPSTTKSASTSNAKRNPFKRWRRPKPPKKTIQFPGGAVKLVDNILKPDLF